MSLTPSRVALNKMLACSKAVQANNDMKGMLVSVGVKGRDIVEREVKRDFGADQAMSNWRRPPRRRYRLAVGFEVRQNNILEFNPRPTGLWQVAEQGRRSGTRGRRRVRNGRGTPSSWGSSRGKLTWSRSQRALVDKIPDEYRKVQRKRIVDAFVKG